MTQRQAVGQFSLLSIKTGRSSIPVVSSTKGTKTKGAGRRSRQMRSKNRKAGELGSAEH